MEIDFDCNFHRDGIVPLLLRGLESPGPNGAHRFVIQATAKRCKDMNIPGNTTAIDDHPEGNRPLPVGPASGITEFRFGGEYRFGGRDALSGVIETKLISFCR